MELYEAIRKRVACRAFDPSKVIPKESILRILAAGAMAPSGENFQPWEFIIIRDRIIRERLKEIKIDSRRRIMKAWHPDIPDEQLDKKAQSQGVAFDTAFWVVAVCYKNVDSLEEIGDMRISMALTYAWTCISYIWLAATAEGIGMSPAFYPYDVYSKAKEILRLPAGYELAAVLRFGYPMKKPLGRKKSVGDLARKLHVECFGNKNLVPILNPE